MPEQCWVTAVTLRLPLLPAGLSKSSDQAYIEFESVEAIVKTASRTKFFIEFYSACLEGGCWAVRRGGRTGGRADAGLKGAPSVAGPAPGQTPLPREASRQPVRCSVDRQGWACSCGWGGPQVYAREGAGRS